MLDHVSIGVRDTAVSKPFYDAALKPLGYLPQPVAGLAGLWRAGGGILGERRGAAGAG